MTKTGLHMKKRHDYTRGNINLNLMLLALPMTIEMIMQSAFNIIDIYFVGKLGPEAISAVTMGGIFIMLIFSLSQGIAIGAGAIVARRIGEHKIKRANDTVLQALLIGGTVSLFIGMLGALYAPSLLRLIGGSEQAVHIGSGYLRISFIGSFTIIYLFVINAIFRGAGEAKAAMYLLGFANICNIILDPLLIFGIGFFPRLGVDGAAYATVISRFLAILIQVLLLLRGKLIVGLHRDHLSPDLEIIRAIVKIAIPGRMVLFLRTFSMLVLARIVNIYGDLAMAAYGIGMRIFHLVLFPGFGLGNAAAALVGQNLGAKNFKRAELSAWLAAGYNSLIMGFASLVFYFFARPIVALFTDNAIVADTGVNLVRMLSHCYVFLGMGLVMGRSFMGAGDAVSPMVINFFSLWVFQLPAAYLLANYTGLKENGIWLALTLTTILNAIAFCVWFKIGRWKKKKV